MLTKVVLNLPSSTTSQVLSVVPSVLTLLLELLGSAACGAQDAAPAPSVSQTVPAA